jgi:hypothetical protein
MIVGFVGRAGSGKDTTADIFTEIVQEEIHRHSFAGALKKDLCRMFDVPETVFHCQKLKTIPMEELYGRSPREMMQWYGTVMRSISTNYWIDRLARTLEGKINLVTDVRYIEEGEFIKNNGGVLVYIDRDSVLPRLAKGSHSSEVDVYETKAICDHFIDNNGDMTSLRAQVNKFVENI